MNKNQRLERINEIIDLNTEMQSIVHESIKLLREFEETE